MIHIQLKFYYGRPATKTNYQDGHILPSCKIPYQFIFPNNLAIVNSWVPMIFAI